MNRTQGLYRAEERVLKNGKRERVLRCNGCGCRMVWDRALRNRLMYLHLLRNRDCVEVFRDLKLFRTVRDEDGRPWSVLRQTICVLSDASPYRIHAIAEDGESVLLWEVHQVYGKNSNGAKKQASLIVGSLVKSGTSTATRTPAEVDRRRLPPIHTPTQDEIRERCKEVQASWTPGERAARIADGETRQIALSSLAK